MTIPMTGNGQYFQLVTSWNTFGIKPDGVAFSDGENVPFKINTSGVLVTIAVIKKEVNLTIEGVSDADVAQFYNLKINTAQGLAAGSFVPPDLVFPGYTIPQAALTDIEPSGPFTAYNLQRWDKMVAKYMSLQFI